MATLKNIVGDTEGQLNAKLQGLAKSKPELYELIVDVASQGQMHLFDDWMKRDVPPSEITALARHLASVDEACPEGLVAYIKQAQKLLKGKLFFITISRKNDRRFTYFLNFVSNCVCATE